jgi:IMP dehydrogenase
MEIEIGRGKKARRAYGFDDIAIVPSRRTRDPDDVDITWKLGPYRFELPLLASAMDGVVSPRSAGPHRQARRARRPEPRGDLHPLRGRRGPARAHRALPKEVATREMQRIYQEPVKPELIRRRIEEIKDQGVVTAASLTPQRVSKYYELALEAGLDILVIQGTVVSAEHVSMTSEPLNLKEFIRSVGVPVIVGGCASYHTGLHLMRTGAAASSSASARARRAPRAASSASGSRRPRPSRTSRARARRTCSRRASTSRSSPTAGCARAATSPRRSPAARTPS